LQDTKRAVKIVKFTVRALLTILKKIDLGEIKGSSILKCFNMLSLNQNTENRCQK
jgi:hypothetical protein